MTPFPMISSKWSCLPLQAAYLRAPTGNDNQPWKHLCFMANSRLLDIPAPDRCVKDWSRARAPKNSLRWPLADGFFPVIAVKNKMAPPKEGPSCVSALEGPRLEGYWTPQRAIQKHRSLCQNSSPTSHNSSNPTHFSQESGKRGVFRESFEGPSPMGSRRSLRPQVRQLGARQR